METSPETPPETPPDTSPACRAVLFDVDDTLYEVAHLVRQAWCANAEKLAALGVDAAALSAAYAQHSHRRQIPAALSFALADLGLPLALAAQIHTVSQDHTPTTLPAQLGVSSLLGDLRDAGVLLGVVTNGEPERQRAKIAALGLEGMFDAVVVCDGTTIPFKPSSAGFAAALAALGLSPAEVVMVGDRVDNDLAPAVAMGMRALRVRVGNHAATPAGPGIWESSDPEAVWDQLRRLVTGSATGR